MTLAGLSWLCCFRKRKERVDLYNSSTISQINLVTHVQDIQQLEQFTENVYDNNFSLFRTVSNDSSPDFKTLERNLKTISAIESTAGSLEADDIVSRPALHRRTSCPIYLSNSRKLFHKTVLDASISVPGSFKSLDDVSIRTRESGYQFSKSVDISSYKRGPSSDPISVISLPVLNRDSSSSEEESFEEYESLCCGLWPVKYRNDDESFHYYDAVLHPSSTIFSRNVGTQTENDENLKYSAGKNDYEDVAVMCNGNTFASIADINPFVDTTEMTSLNSRDSQNESTGTSESSDAMVMNAEKIYDDAFSMILSGNCSDMGWGNLTADISEQCNDLAGDCKTFEATEYKIATDMDEFESSHQVLDKAEKQKSLESCLKRTESRPAYENTHSALEGTVRNLDKRLGNMDTAENIDSVCTALNQNCQEAETIFSNHMYDDEPIYDDISNTVGNSLGFIPCLEEPYLEKSPYAQNNDDYKDEILYDTVGNCVSFFEQKKKLIEIKENNTEDNKTVYNTESNYAESVENNLNSHSDQEDHSFEENLYDVVGNFAADTNNRFSVTDIMIATQMLESYDTDIVYENLNHVVRGASADCVETTLESSRDFLSVKFEVGDSETDSSNSDSYNDDENLYDVIGSIQTEDGLVMRLSDIVQVMLSLLILG